MAFVGTVREIWRYPVKSMGGERLQSADVTEEGVLGDRLWAVRDEGKGQIATGKRIAELMLCEARFVRPPVASPRAGHVDVPPVRIALPDGLSVRSDQPDANKALSAALGRDVTLWPLRPASDRAHYRAKDGADPEALRRTFGLGPGEPLPDLSALPARLLLELSRYATPRGTYVDAFPLHVITTGALRRLSSKAPGVDADARRFRPNLLVETDEHSEDDRTWCGGLLCIGEARIRVDAPTVRCVMPARAQVGVPACPEMTRAIAGNAGHHFGVYARVLRPGAVRVGDAVELEPRVPSSPRRWLDRRTRDVKRMVLRAVEDLLTHGVR